MQDNRADEQLVADLLRARDAGLITALPSQREVDFDLASGYRIGRALHERLLERGHRAVGRKIGFTNPVTWKEFNVNTPMWAHMYARTVRLAERGRSDLSLNGMVAPRLEPEVVLKLRGPIPTGNRTAAELVPCVEWVAIGFEIVDSHYPGWRFTGADAVADFGVHAAMIVGAPWPLGSAPPEEVAESLETLTVTLRRGAEVFGRGEGRNALGNPLLALGYLARVLSTQPWAPPLAAGEIITTGTLTPPPYILPGERWDVEVAGAPLASLQLELDK